MSRTSAAGSQSDRRHHRQPEREKRGKRGACIDPNGYDAGKKRQRRRCAEIKGKKRHILVDTVGLLLHAIVHPHLDVEIVKRSDQVSGFVVLPKRWIVERTIAWLNRCRRLAKDWENLN